MGFEVIGGSKVPIKAWTRGVPIEDSARQQIENVKAHGVTPVVAINGFPTDHKSEHDAIRKIAEAAGARVAVCTHFADGGVFDQVYVAAK